MECVILTGASTSALQSTINAWLIAQAGTVTIKYVMMSEGTVGSTTIKVIIFYEIGVHAARS
jgi:hypothetical protein